MLETLASPFFPGGRLTGLVQVGASKGLLEEARKKEDDFNWLAAIDIYSRTIDPSFGESSQGEFLELRGRAYFRAAFQTGSAFEENVRKSFADYNSAGDWYAKLGEHGRLNRCKAMAAFAGFWLTLNHAERKANLSISWQRARMAMDAFEAAGHLIDFGRAFTQFSLVASLLAAYEGALQPRRTLVDEVVIYGEKAVKMLEHTPDAKETARAYVRVAAYIEAAGGFLEKAQDKESEYKKARDYWNKAVQQSEEAAFLELSQLFNFLVYSSLEWGDGTDKALANWKKAAEYASRTRDRLTIGTALDFLAHHHFWKAHATDNPDEREKLAARAVEYSEEASKHYVEISFASPRGGTLWCDAPRPEYYWLLARFEAKPERKRELLSKALEYAPDMLHKATSSGYPEIVWTAHHVFSKILLSLASIEKDPTERKRFLEQALEHRQESIRINDALEPYNYWNLGVLQSGLADIKAELAGLISEQEDRRAMIEQAIENAERCLEYCSRVIPFSEALGTAVGRWQRLYGDLWSKLFGLSHDTTHLSNAIQAYGKVVNLFQKPSQPSRAAECYWKMAIGFGVLGDFLGAAEKFRLASESYALASENYQQLKSFYQEYASYMQAWAEIENAHYYHARQEYSRAREHYDRAAALHESTRHWNYLTPNYSAWAILENAENLSRREESGEAIGSFEKASRLFKQAGVTLTTRLGHIDDEDEKEMAKQLAHASNIREQYCIARMALEEARILGRRGDHSASMDKFGKAAESFNRMTTVLTGQDRVEVELIMRLSRAWQTMAKAEADASPTLYLDASRLFEQAKEIATTETSKLLALGHSRFCKALELSAKYTDTSSEGLYNLAVQELETADNYYLRAGSQKHSEYARASRLLLDAYSHLKNGDLARDQQEKARLYLVAEKVLRVSAGSFAKAGYPDKAQQVSRLLSRVSQDRELAVSLAQLLSAPPIVTDTGTFPTPTPSLERPVGLERFERGHVEGDMKLDKEGLTVGGNLTVELRLTNAGRTNVQIVSLESVVPHGFDIVEKPTICRVDGNNLDMRGRQLAPMKTETVKLSVRPGHQGTFQLSPGVRFIDERGEYGVLELNPSTVVVMGSDTRFALPIMEFLAKRFVEEYMTKRLSMDDSGWCGLMEISKALEIPKAQVYGDSSHGHTFGKPLQSLVKGGLVEYRIFTGARGRGGRVLKVRVNYEKQPVKSLVDELALKPLGITKIPEQNWTSSESYT